jgi:hypothetical protein
MKLLHAFFALAKAWPHNAKRKYFRELLALFSSQQKAYISYTERPHRPQLSYAGSYPRTDYESTAIVMQGPILHDNDFTLETLRYYSGLHPSCRLILSTWVDEDVSDIQSSNIPNLRIIQNGYPENPGPGHINYQITSSTAGIRIAIDEGYAYAFKTRTDQRMYSPSAVSLCHSLINTFPLKGGSKQSKRIIACGLNTYKYRLYPISDMFSFGTIEDMWLLWNTPHDDREKPGQLDSAMGEYSKSNLCEIYLTTHFLEQIGHSLKWTLEDSWKAITQHYCIVDPAMLDLFWPKYEREFQESLYADYNQANTREELTFSDWLNMLNAPEDIKTPEEILSLNFGEPIPKL